ncbi:MAG: flavin reductase family protein [Elusimicrobiota bacterium]
MSILQWLETPVVIVGAKAGEKSNWMTAAWVTHVSFKPPLLAVSIGPERYTHSMIKASRAFSISVLREGQEDVAKDLGFRSGAREDKLKGYKVTTAKTGAPILEDAGAYYDCRVVGQHTAGDHTLFIGEVVGEKLLDGGPFLPFKSDEYF